MGTTIVMALFRFLQMAGAGCGVALVIPPDPDHFNPVTCESLGLPLAAGLAQDPLSCICIKSSFSHIPHESVAGQLDPKELWGRWD